MNDDRQGCLGFLLKGFIYSKLHDMAQRVFGYKSGGGCFGCGCGCFMLVIFVLAILSMFFETDFTKLGF